MKILLTAILIINCTFNMNSQCWKEISLGLHSTLIIDESKNLYACGFNFSGQLGIGSSYFSTDTFIEVLPKSHWEKISCGNYHTLAIKDDGTLWAWGKNQYGQLGNGNKQDQSTPIQIGADNDWDEINTGYHFSIAKKKDGTLWSWGSNLFGQLGFGDHTDRLVPKKISNMVWTKFTTGNVHCVAIRNDGSLWAWGNNINGQLGDGTTNESVAPKMISSNRDWTSISSEGLHTLAIKADGTLWAWGNNYNGVLGIDTTVTMTKSPIQVGNESNWHFINTSESNSAAIKKDGTLWMWGSNEFGQLGDKDTLSKFSPLKFNNDNDWNSISMGLFHIGALKKDDTFYTWGSNSIGQLGIGNLVNSDVPIKIQCASITNAINLITQKEESYIYPNPTINGINFISEKVQILHIFNLFGVEVGNFKVNEGTNYLDLSYLETGNYVIKPEKGKYELLKKIY